MWDYLLKFIIIGDTSVGKSSLLVRLTEDRFLVDATPTIGIEFGSHLVRLDSGECLKLQVWDTAGSEQFRSITRSYFKGAAGCLLVYDVTSHQSFESLPIWLDEIRDQAEENVTIALVGNMADRAPEHRAVSAEEAQEFAQKNNLLFYETSAKSGDHVVEVFDVMARVIFERYMAKGTKADTRNYQEGRIDLNAPDGQRTCCTVM